MRARGARGATAQEVCCARFLLIQRKGLANLRDRYAAKAAPACFSWRGLRRAVFRLLRSNPQRFNSFPHHYAQNATMRKKNQASTSDSLPPKSMDFTLSLNHRTMDLTNQALAAELPKIQEMIDQKFPEHAHAPERLVFPQDPKLVDFINETLARELPKINNIIRRGNLCPCGSTQTWDHTEKSWACDTNCCH